MVAMEYACMINKINYNFKIASFYSYMYILIITERSNKIDDDMFVVECL